MCCRLEAMTLASTAPCRTVPPQSCLRRYVRVYIAMQLQLRTETSDNTVELVHRHASQAEAGCPCWRTAIPA